LFPIVELLARRIFIWAMEVVVFLLPTILDFANIYDVTVGDFNGDSNLDFAISAAAGTVQPWFGNGSGITFTPGAAISGFNGSQPIIAHDLDGDGDLDLSSSNAYTLNDGAGNFAARIGFVQTGHYMTIGDLNGDGKPDIIASDNSMNYQHMRVFTGDGTGTFTLLAKFETNVNPRSIQLIDVNNDGNLDAVGVGTAGTTHSADVLFGDGTGFFTNSILKYPFPAGYNPQDIAKGDFNKDGKIDVAICHSAANLVTVHLGEDDNRFTKTNTNYNTGTFPFQIIAVDYNNDSNLDIITYNNSAGSITVLTGNGMGEFTLLGNTSTSATAGRMTYGDFNNDNFIDIVITNGSGQAFSILTGTGSGFNSPVITSLTERAYEIKSIDFNNDGNLDLVTDYDSGFGTLTGNGNGTFTIGTSRLQVSGSFFLVADINYDTFDDVVAFSNSNFGNDIFMNDGTGVFTGSSISTSLGGFPYGFEDMNNDGFKDLIIGAQLSISSEPGQIVVFRGNATGISNSVLVDQDGSGGSRLIIHDLNGNGKLDIVTTSFNIYEDYFSVLINTTTPVGCPSISLQPNSETTCEGQPAFFSVSASGNAPLSYQWRKGTVNINGATSAIYSIDAVTPADAGVYNCVISNACGSVISSNATLVVNPAPTNPITVSSSRCGSGTVTLSASGGTPGNYVWFNNLTDFIPISGAVNDTYTTPVLATTTSFYVAIVSGSCTSGLVQAIATINPAPAAPTVTNSSSCGPGTITLVASGGTNGQYRWYDVATGGTAIAGEVNNTFNTPALTISTTYYVSINTGSCESARTEAIAPILPIPAKPTITANQPINAGVVEICLQTVILSAPIGFTSYAWNNSQITQQINALQPGNYTVSVTDASGCSSTPSDPIQVINATNCVNNPPVINTTSATTFIGGKIIIDLSDLISDPDDNLDVASLQIIGGATQKGGKTSLNGFILEIDYAAAKFSGKDLVTIRVCDLLNVCFETNLEIEVIGDIVVYNGISPNNDGVNDNFIIQYIDLLPETIDNKVSIYNRWGSKVFEVSNYNNTTNVFRGLNNNGNELPSGTYFYKIEFKDNKRSTEKGYLSLKR
jgi:gliding motility-associated-like protein